MAASYEIVGFESSSFNAVVVASYELPVTSSQSEVPQTDIGSEAATYRWNQYASLNISTSLAGAENVLPRSRLSANWPGCL